MKKSHNQILQKAHLHRHTKNPVHHYVDWTTVINSENTLSCSKEIICKNFYNGQLTRKIEDGEIQFVR